VSKNPPGNSSKVGVLRALLMQIEMDDAMNPELKQTKASGAQPVEDRSSAAQLALEVMHEIRNPLEALNNLVYLALNPANDLATVREYLRLAQEQAVTLNGIAHQVLGFARSSGSPKPAKLATVAEAALRIHQRTIEAKRIRLVSDLPDDLVAEINTGEVLQVVSNIIHNALDALPPGGTLRLRLRKHRGEAQFVIADNGNGIPKEHLTDVFQPFFTTKGEKGTGLGLAISKAIVERQQGKLRVWSSFVRAKAEQLSRFLFRCARAAVLDSPVTFGHRRPALSAALRNLCDSRAAMPVV
jgi:signal transduction histidine kinase